MQGPPGTFPFAVGRGLALDGGALAVANGGITETLLAEDAVTNAKVAAGALSTDRLSGSQAAPGDLLRFDGTRWAPAAPPNLAAGPGLTLAAGTISLDAQSVQAPIVGSCSTGQAVRQISRDGGVVCESIPFYTGSNGITVTGTAISGNTNVLQARVSATCASGSSIRQVNGDGTVVCQPDTNTTYSPGTGLNLTGTAFSADTAYLQRRVSGSCSSGAIVAVSADGAVTCGRDDRFGGGSSTTETALVTDSCITGEVRLFAGFFAPRGFGFADGRVMNISAHQALFAIVGNLYGGDGVTTFALPDLRNTVPRSNGAPLQYIICINGIFPFRN